MEALKGFLAWRWTPFFALLTVALVVSLVTILVVPSTPLTLFEPEPVKAAALTDRAPSAALTKTGLNAAGRSSTAGRSSALSSRAAASGAVSSGRRGSLQKMIDSNLENTDQPPSRPEHASRRFSRADPGLAAPPLPPPAQGDVSEEEEEAEEEEEEAEEEAEAEPAAEGAGGAEGEGDTEAPDVGIDRPQFLNPGALRAIPRIQTPQR